jgi:hypothetical protein
VLSFRDLTRASLTRRLLLCCLSASILATGGCKAEAATLPPSSTNGLTGNQLALTSFSIVNAGGISIARPSGWLIDTSNGVIYQAERTSYIRVTVAVIPALPIAYYDNLVTQGTVSRSTIAGCPAYRNDYTYPNNGYTLTTTCLTIVNGTIACHIMTLCDSSVLPAFQPVFDYIANSLMFN